MGAAKGKQGARKCQYDGKRKMEFRRVRTSQSTEEGSRLEKRDDVGLDVSDPLLLGSCGVHIGVVEIVAVGGKGSGRRKGQSTPVHQAGR
jgi:hypothetical protein